MKCPGCGQENVNEANFCSACNHSFKADSNTNTPAQQAVPQEAAPVTPVTSATPVASVSAGQQTSPQQQVSAQPTAYPQQAQTQPVPALPLVLGMRCLPTWTPLLFINRWTAENLNLLPI